MKDAKPAAKPPKPVTTPVKAVEAKESCPVRPGDILKDPAAGGG